MTWSNARVTTDPRVERTRATVLPAARDVLSERGYEGFTVEEVVARTGVAKTTIYRHWPTRTDLLHAALSSAKAMAPIQESGDLRADLIALLRSVAAATDRDVFLRSMPSLIAAARHEPDLRALHDRLAEDRSSRLRALLVNARSRGDLRPDCDTDLLAQSAIGLVFVRRIFRGLPVSTKQIATVVDMLLYGAAPPGNAHRVLSQPDR